jgi:hypothetical protein
MSDPHELAELSAALAATVAQEAEAEADRRFGAAIREMIAAKHGDDTAWKVRELLSRT